jgi:hypothetical protein
MAPRTVPARSSKCRQLKPSCPSPRTKRIRKGCVKVVQEEAFKELLRLRGRNGGKVGYGDIQALVIKYKTKGYPEVTRDNLYYRLKSIRRKGHQEQPDIATLEHSDVVIVSSSPTVAGEVSGLTTSSKSGGHPKDSTKAAAKKRDDLVSKVTADCVQEYQKEREICKAQGKNVTNGMLEKIATMLEKENNLAYNTINRCTIRYQLETGNVTGAHAAHVSPIEDIELMIV